MPSPEQREYAELLLQKARGDLTVVRTLSGTASIDDAIGFHAQQAVEKAVKAVLVIAGVEIPHTHDLERLLGLCRAANWDPPKSVSDSIWLTPWAVDFRYDEPAEPLDATAALAVADATVAWTAGALDQA